MCTTRPPPLLLLACLLCWSPDTVISCKLLVANSIAARLNKCAETRHVFDALGLAGMGIMLLIGVYSFFSPSAALRLADLVSAFGEALVVGRCDTCVILFCQWHLATA